MKFQYSPLPDVGEPLVKRLGRYPRVPDITWESCRWLGRWLGVLLLRLNYRLQVTGRIPTGDRVALVANHRSHLDTLTLLAALPGRERQRVVVLAAQDYFFNRLDRALAASLLCQAVAFDREQKTSLRSWYERLQAPQKDWILFYPSGSRKRTEVQVGLLKLLVRTGWRIVPVRLEGTERAWPVGRRFWRPGGSLQIHFFEAYAGLDVEPLLARLQQELV